MDHEVFLGSLIDASSGIRAAYQEVQDEWLPEEPPITRLYAALGYRIAEEFPSADVATNRHIFSLIEEAMEKGDRNLMVAVATGLIEALATRSSQIENLWQQIEPHLGPRSLHHAEAWLAP